MLRVSRRLLVLLIILALYAEPLLTGLVSPVFAANPIQITPGNSGGGGAANYLVASVFTASSGGTMTDLGIKLSSALSSGNKLVLGIYQDASNYPGTLLGQTNEITSGSAGWVTASLQTSVPISASTKYWLAYLPNFNSKVSYDAGGTSRYYSSTYTSTLPATFTSSSTSQSYTYALEYIETTGPPPADYSIASVPTSSSVGAGSTASYTINLAAGGGYSGSVTLSLDAGTPCPLGATCTFTPATPIALSTTASATFSVQTVLGGYTGTTSLQIDASDGGSHNHQVTVSLTVTAPANFQFNVKGTATQVVVTLMYSSSSAPPAASLTIAGPVGNPTLAETAGTVYDRTTITVTSGTPAYNVIHRVTWTISAPGSAQVWTVYVSLSGVSSYTVTIEVS